MLNVLRNDLGLSAAKFGCGLGQCGACVAMVGGKLARTCSNALADVGNDKVVVFEGLSTVQGRPLQKAFRRRSVWIGVAFDPQSAPNIDPA